MQFPGDETAFAKQALGMGMPGQNGEILCWEASSLSGPAVSEGAWCCLCTEQLQTLVLFQVQSLNRAICQTCHAYSKRQVGAQQLLCSTRSARLPPRSSAQAKRMTGILRLRILVLRRSLEP